jgi:hypothetical protein
MPKNLLTGNHGENGPSQKPTILWPTEIFRFSEKIIKELETVFTATTEGD